MAGASRFSMQAVVSLVDKVSGPINTAGKSVDRFATRAQQRMSMASRAVNGFAGAFRSLVPVLSAGLALKFANDSMEAWKIQETAIANVEAGLKSTDNAIGITSKKFQQMASDIQSTGIFGDEVILQNATSQLLTFGNIGASNFDRIQRAALDVAAKLKGVNATSEDIRATAIMMGKAMDDPVRGMNAMRRVGISFSADEEKAIKAMTKMNDTVGAQNLMLKAIERQYGGTNEALRNTTAGMDIAAKNDMGDTMELIGQQIMPLKQSLLELAVFILPKLNAVIPVLVDVFKKLSPLIIGLAGGFVTYKLAVFAAMGIQKIMMGIGWIKYLWMMRAAIMSATGVTSAWTAVQWLLNAAMTANPIGVIVVGIGLLIAAGIALVKYWEPISTFFSNLWDGIVESFSSAINWIVGKFKAVTEWISKKWQAVKGFFGGGDTNVNVNQNGGGTVNSGRAPAGMNASPNARGITNTNTTNGRLAIDVNTNGNENVAVKQQGKLPPNMSLAYGRAR